MKNSDPEAVALRETLASDDEAAITDAMRGMNVADLSLLAGRTTPWGDWQAQLHAAASPAAIRIATRHRQLRDDCDYLVRSALAALGHAFHHTGGWWITAYATPEGRLGFVNVAHGIAAETSIAISPEMVTALTIPRQRTGPVASGAARWSSPDPGEAHRASAPDGWVQLLAEVRDIGPVAVPAEGMTARIVAWCLMTCYDRRGYPGYTRLDGQSATFPRDEGILGPLEWPATREQREAMNAAGVQHLDRIARIMAGEAGISEQVAAVLDGDGKPWQRVSAAQALADPPPGTYHSFMSPEQAASDAAGHSTAAGPATEALHDVELVARACGDAPGPSSYWRLIDALARKVIRDRLVPLVPPVMQAIPDHTRPPTRTTGTDYSHWHNCEKLIRHAAEQIAGIACDAAVRATREADAAMQAAYHGGQPVTVDIPLPVPGHLPWKRDQVVGLAEIAARLGVARSTVDTWRTRAKNNAETLVARLPEPMPGTVGGDPAWLWGTVEDWARATGRITEDGAIRKPRADKA